MTYQTFTLSSKLFGGYTIRKHVNEIESIEDVINELIKSLNDDLKRSNLHELQMELSKLKFHYHDYDLLDVLTSAVETTWYICEGACF